MITIKNEKDSVTQKPLKIELVIENWKSSNLNSPSEVVQPNLGTVKRLVNEYNTIEDVSKII